MRRKIPSIIAVALTFVLSGCFGNEPNDTAYVAALGIDIAPSGNYDITIQFARPTQISGGSSEEGGKGGSGIVENISIEAPDIYSALNTANHIVSKKFSLAHAKLVVFSSEMAKNGIRDIIESLGRNDEIRPDLITAVSRETAREYLENAQPLVELNPAKYYQLIYEENESGGVPKKTGLEVIFEITGDHRDTVMPLSGVAKATEEDKSGGGSQGGSSSGGSQGGGSSGGSQGGGSQGGGSSGGSESGGSQGGGSSGGSESSGASQGGGSSGGSQDGSSQGGSSSGGSQGGGSSGGSESGGSQGGGSSGGSQGGDSSGKGAKSGSELPSDSDAPINTEGFQYKTRNYKAGEVKLLQKDKSEVLGMAVFKGDKLVAELGETEADIYNILNGDYKDNYTSFYSEESPQQAVTVRLSQRSRPAYRIDKKEKKIKIKLNLEGNLYSLPYDYELESEIDNFEKNTAKEISRKSAEFVTMMRDEYGADVLGIGEKARKCFADLDGINDYNWDEKFKEYSIEVDTNFKIRHSGIMYRSKK